MATVDFDTEEGDAWYSMVRTTHLAGREIDRTRPPMSRQEALLAREVNSYAFRVQFGYGSGRNPDALPCDPVCHRCGARDVPLILVGAVYLREGRVDKYRCADYCQGGQRGEAGTV